MRHTNPTHLQKAGTLAAGMVLLVLIGIRLAAAQPAAPAEPELRRGQPVREEEDGPENGDGRAGRRTAFYRRLAAKAEGGQRGNPARLSHYLDVFKREVVKDARLFAFDVRARTAADGAGAIVLEGFIEYVEQRDALLSFLRALGFDRIDDHIETATEAVAPGASRLGLVTSPRAFLFDRTATPRETVSECTIGEAVYLLSDEQDGHFLCHAGDGYVGYVGAGHVLRVDQRAFDDYRGGGARVVLLKTIDHEGSKIPIGATLKAAGGGVVLPDGRTIPVDSQDVRRVTIDPRVERVVETALTMAGTKYVWGGKTAEGIDCSGLVQLAYRAHGVHLPRDSDQQALVGGLVATRWHRSGLRRGDTLFFLGRHGTVTHTALYLGDQRYVEAAGPDVRVSSFDPKDKAYAERNARSFCFARRVLE